MEEEEGGRGTQAVRILLRSSEGVKGRAGERGGETVRQTDKWRWPLHVLVKFVWPPRRRFIFLNSETFSLCIISCAKKRRRHEVVVHSSKARNVEWVKK